MTSGLKIFTGLTILLTILAYYNFYSYDDAYPILFIGNISGVPAIIYNLINLSFSLVLIASIFTRSQKMWAISMYYLWGITFLAAATIFQNVILYPSEWAQGISPEWRSALFWIYLTISLIYNIYYTKKKSYFNKK